MVPYISMRSPGSVAPTLTASVHASMVPMHTGMPDGSPEASAASTLTRPTTSPGQRRGGNSSSGTIRSVHGWYQPSASESYSGVHWLAEW